MSVTKIHTVADLLAMGPDISVELIEGEPKEAPHSELHASAVAMNIAGPLHTYVRRRRLGLVSGENGGFILSRNPDTVVPPDVAFIRRERIVEGLGHGSFSTVPPDLAVEVMSQTDRFADVMRKATRYLAAGVQLVWLVRPNDRVVVVLGRKRDPRELSIGDTLDGEDVVPGFRLPLTEIFD
ncbi:MAG: Uma2 family endonuclease [Thermomicrobiales bacterium]|nr:Uma2 family endonuclease [Thermomicrobiales bacterium]